MKRKGTAKWSTILHTLYWWVHRVSEVCPFGMQEPFLDKRLPAVLTNCKLLNPKVRTLVYTNMSIYDEDVWRKILRWQMLDTLAVSFYGVTKQIYEALQPPLSFEAVKQNIKSLVKLKRKMHCDKPEVNLHILLMPETLKRAQKFAVKYRPLLDNVGYVRWDSWCGRKPYSDEWESKVWGPSEESRFPCPRLWRILQVHYDGTIVPCCLDAHEMEPCGNILDDHEAFYNNPRLNELRTLHLKGEQDTIPLCRDCTVWRRDHDPVWNQIWRKHTKTVSSAVNPYTK